MFSSLYIKPLFPINQKMSDYCNKSINESIRKIIEKDQERKDNKGNFNYIKVNTMDDSPNPPNENHLIIPVVYLLSSTSILYIFYKYFR